MQWWHCNAFVTTTFRRQGRRSDTFCLHRWLDITEYLLWSSFVIALQLSSVSLWMMTTHKTRSAVIVHSKNYRRGCYYCYLTIPYHHCWCCWQFNQPHVHISRISSSLTIIIPQITSRAHFCHCWASFSSFAVYSMGGWMDQSIFVFRVCLSHLKIPFNNM